jgi:hypothetical protein
MASLVFHPTITLADTTMSQSIADHTTVVADRDYAPNTDFLKPRPPPTEKVKSTSVTHDFLSQADESLEERPFFVHIGKDGLIAALQKLDAQLVQVKVLDIICRDLL